MITSFIGVLFDGVAYGSLLFLISIGLSVTMGLMNFINLAHGAFAMLGGYAAVVAMSRLGIPFLPSLVIAFVLSGAVGALFEMAPVTLLRSRDLAALGDEQRAALAVFFMRLSAQTMNVFLILFGFRCIALGYLILRSSFMPRVIGGLLVLAGVAYLPNLWPPLVTAITPFHLVLAIGELVLVVWLLVRGVDDARWHAQAAATYRGTSVSS